MPCRPLVPRFAAVSSSAAGTPPPRRRAVPPLPPLPQVCLHTRRRLACRRPIRRLARRRRAVPLRPAVHTRLRLSPTPPAATAPQAIRRRPPAVAAVVRCARPGAETPGAAIGQARRRAVARRAAHPFTPAVPGVAPRALLSSFAALLWNRPPLSLLSSVTALLCHRPPLPPPSSATALLRHRSPPPPSSSAADLLRRRQCGLTAAGDRRQANLRLRNLRNRGPVKTA